MDPGHVFVKTTHNGVQEKFLLLDASVFNSAHFLDELKQIQPEGLSKAQNEYWGNFIILTE